MGFDRRNFLKSAAATAAVSPLISAGAGAKPVPTTLDDRLALDGLEEVVVTFRRHEDIELLEAFDLPEGYYGFEVLPMAYTVATEAQIRELAGRQAVRRITPNYELEYFNDEARSATGAETVAEDLGYDGRHGHVAVVDTGIGALHPDHRVNVANNYQQLNPLSQETMWVDVGAVDTDDNGHGTHVAGTVGGDGTANWNHRGMAPRATLTMYSTGATLLIVNALGAFDHIAAEKRAGRSNVQAVNNSFGPVGGNDADWDPDSPYSVATYELYDAGVLPIFAAGNCGPNGGATCLSTGTNTQTNPSQAPWALAVAATEDNRNVAGFSSRGRPEDYDGLVNYDRQRALRNYEEYRRSLQPPGEADATESFYEIGASGVQLPLTALLVEAGAGGGIAEVDEFTLEPEPETELETVDGYFLSTTLTWTPSTGDGVPEPSEFYFRLDGPDGETVATAGSTFVDQVRNETSLTIERWLPVPEAPASYTLKVSASRGGGQYEVTGDLLAVDAEDAPPAPERPYSLYRPSVGAPGASVKSTMMPTTQLGAQAAATDGEPFYAEIQGTSMAAPVVGGTVALMNDAYYREFDEYPDVLDVIEAIESTADFQPEARNHTVESIGRGFVDAEAAVEEILSRGPETAAQST
jgi:serine protease AprX